MGVGAGASGEFGGEAPGETADESGAGDRSGAAQSALNAGGRTERETSRWGVDASVQVSALRSKAGPMTGFIECSGCANPRFG